MHVHIPPSLPPFSPQVVVKVLQSGVGDVTQSDVSLASVSKATIIAFNVAADNPVRFAFKHSFR